MLIATPTRPLGYVDCQALTERVLTADEALWHADNRRQDDYEVHVETQSIILVFFTGWPTVRVDHESGWDVFADVAMPVMQRIVADHYEPGGIILRAMLARLPPRCRIDKHVDKHPSFSIAHRVHVPLITNPDVEFVVGEQHIQPVANHAFELNNVMPHSVVNNGVSPRVHFIFDYAPN